MEPLRGKQDFDRLFASGTFRRGRYLAVRYVDNRAECTRVAIVTGRRFSASAVQRNRARRRVREALCRVGLAPGFDVVVLPRREALTASWDALCSDLATVLARTPAGPASAGR